MQQDGFSLIETLVALAVLAVSATAILGATETHTRTIAAVSDRLLAQWVAQNSMVSLRVAQEVPQVQQMGRTDWRVSLDRTATGDPDLIRADISVSSAAAPDTVLARLTGFVARPNGGAE